MPDDNVSGPGKKNSGPSSSSESAPEKKSGQATEADPDQPRAPGKENQGQATNQSESKDQSPPVRHTVLQCFVFLARQNGVDLSVDRIIHEWAVGDKEVELSFLSRPARRYGFKARAVRLDYSDLSSLGRALPVLARLRNGNGVIIFGVREREGGREIIFVDPLSDRPGAIILPFERFSQNWDGEALLLKRRYGLSEMDQPFGFRWFIPEILRQKRFFIDVALASVMLYLVGLAVPIFFQLIIDKVLVHQSFSTLYVLTAGVIIALLFEAGFRFIRQVLLLFGSRRIDIRVTRRTFGHLLSLPLEFFERRYAGVLTKHMQQSEKIRQFLTGRLFLTGLDALSLVVFVPILFLYSVKLTLVVLVFTGIIAAIMSVLIRPFRRRLQELYLAEGDRQAYLVENLHGMNTVKSLALEPNQKQEWDNKAALAVSKHFRVGMISAVAGNLTKMIERLMMVAVIFLGALDVFAGTLSVGALVAFQMISARVTGPLVQMVSLIHEYQETSLSIKMLGEVMNASPERIGVASGLRPSLKGRITFEDVSFTYPGYTLPALTDFSLNIPEATVLGVVGRSGSGKTTMARLIQGLYTTPKGIVRIDGLDIREIDTSHLRRSIGVVLQENFLFRGTFKDNIAITKKGATFAEIRQAASLAGADEFIERLPQGFDTMLEEGGANLSGGQRQRLAIARALLTRPRILIFDEATSSLDPESEAIIKRNLAQISKGRTVVMISHRLTNLIDAQAIVVLDQGRQVGFGTHQQLLAQCDVYRRLWQQQTGSWQDRG
jgi:subfamily B ATP-binding cassette protein HlyB/CyaB